MFGPCFVLQYLGQIKKISLFPVMGGNNLGMVGTYNFLITFFLEIIYAFSKCIKLFFFQKT